MANQGLIDKLASAPKWAIIGGVVLLILVAGYVMYYFAFASKKPVSAVEDSSVFIDLPDPELNEVNSTTMLDIYSRNEDEDFTSSSGKRYWDELGGDLVSSGDAEKPSTAKKRYRRDELDPNQYTAFEITQIVEGVRSKEEIDEEHARSKKEYADAMRSLNAQIPKPVNSDSMVMARMEMALEMASRYQQQNGQYQQPQGAVEPAAEEPEEEGRKIEIEQPNNLPTDALADDGIISSLDSPSDDGYTYDGTKKRKPVKATFLKNEKLNSGQRVIIRLVQDLTLSDGTVIPANTHITGTCSFNRRLKIDVKMLHYGGRMFPCDLSIYDNDGTEGLYCPITTPDEKGKKTVKDVAGTALSAAGSIAGTILTGNPLLGSMASSSLMAATSSISSDGTVTINVSAGYEFYIYENVKDEKTTATTQKMW